MRRLSVISKSKLVVLSILLFVMLVNMAIAVNEQCSDSSDCKQGEVCSYGVCKTKAEARKEQCGEYFGPEWCSEGQEEDIAVGSDQYSGIEGTYYSPRGLCGQPLDIDASCMQCGDGICSTGWGENAKDCWRYCPEDCRGRIIEGECPDEDFEEEEEETGPSEEQAAEQSGILNFIKNLFGLGEKDTDEEGADVEDILEGNKWPIEDESEEDEGISRGSSDPANTRGMIDPTSKPNPCLAYCREIPYVEKHSGSRARLDAEGTFPDCVCVIEYGRRGRLTHVERISGDEIKRFEFDEGGELVKKETLYVKEVIEEEEKEERNEMIQKIETDKIKLEDKFNDIAKDLSDEGHYVRNPWMDKDPSMIGDGLRKLGGIMWDHSIGQFFDHEGLTCRDYTKKTKDSVKKSVEEMFGEKGTKVEIIAFEERSTYYPGEGTFGGIKSWIDSWNDENHILIKVTLPDGTEKSVDFWDNARGEGPVIGDWDETVTKWKYRIGEDEFWEIPQDWNDF